MSLPWQVSVILGAFVFAGLKWLLPSIWANSLLLSSVATGLSSIAWLPGGFLLLVGAFAYIGQRIKASKALAASNRDPQAAWKPPARAPKEGLKRGPFGETQPDLSIHIEADTRTKEKPAEWSLELIREIEWKRFEDLCQKFYETKGIRCETTPLGPDGGIDIRIYQDESGKATSIVQCKAWGARYVGVQPIRELLGVMTHEKIEKAFFMTSGRFSDDAKDVAKSNRITLIDGQMLLMMLQRLPTAGKNELLNFATEGDYTTPTCPGCGKKMKSVPGKAGRPDFWGCPDYPKCRQRLGMRRAA